MSTRGRPTPRRPAPPLRRPARPTRIAYRWLAADGLKFPAAVDTLEARFPTPPGYVRVSVRPGSFSEWLRGLPLAAQGTPVLSHAGDTVFSGDDAYVAAVVAIVVGAGDLQQSADAVDSAAWRVAVGERPAERHQLQERDQARHAFFALGQRPAAARGRTEHGLGREEQAEGSDVQRLSAVQSTPSCCGRTTCHWRCARRT